MKSTFSLAKAASASSDQQKDLRYELRQVRGAATLLLFRMKCL